MRESAHAALTYLRGRAQDLGLPADFLDRAELHVHAPEGAVPKEGPSAGVALCVAMLSALVGAPVRRHVAMTGEVTLRGRVLPVGGIREKVLAARRAGARVVVLPAGNRGDWEELCRQGEPGLEPVFVEHVDEAVARALVGGWPRPQDTVRRAPAFLFGPVPGEGQPAEAPAALVTA